VSALAAVILAAGQSSRMGRPKLLLPWAGTTILGQLIQLWSQAQATHIAVVCAPNDAGITAELDRLGFPAENRIINPNPARGMFSSIQCAARWHGWNASLTHWAVSLGDQPQLRLETLITLADFASQHPGKICQPRCGGHARHPVVLPKPAFMALAGSQFGTLKEFLEQRAGESAFVEIDDRGLELDIDRPADYEAALKIINIPGQHSDKRKRNNH
jgi:molybdenum cofactor cytidylyltransferase